MWSQEIVVEAMVACSFGISRIEAEMWSQEIVVEAMVVTSPPAVARLLLCGPGQPAAAPDHIAKILTKRRRR